MDLHKAGAERESFHFYGRNYSESVSEFSLFWAPPLVCHQLFVFLHVALQGLLRSPVFPSDREGYHGSGFLRGFGIKITQMVSCPQLL